MATISSYATAAGDRYRVRYRTPDHRQTDKRGFRTLKEARAFAATVEVAKLRGEYVSEAAGRVTVGTLGAARLERRRATLKPSTWHSESSAWRVHVEPRWGSEPIGKIRASAVEAWIAQLHSTGLSATTISRAHGVLHGILADAVRDRQVSTNVAAKLKLPRKVSAPRSYLTHRQVDALASATRTAEQAAIIRTLAYTGLRWGELTGLRVRNVDLQRRRIHVAENAVRVGAEIVTGSPKTHEKRSVPFSPFLRRILTERVEGKARDALAIGNGVDHIRPPATDHAWFAAAANRARANDASFPEKLTPHDLRHTAASLAIASGASVLLIQRMLGHASAAMTLDTYADLFDTDLDAVGDSLERARSSALGRGRSRRLVGKVWAKRRTQRRERPTLPSDTGAERA